ncbi:hypothetical protein PMAYCL1PPCAC_20489, partial [Pristionchus mayeri]
LRFAFAFDRDYLFDVFQMCQIALPIVNTLTVHPLALIMLRCKSRTMGADIRLGYFLTEISLIVHDWLFSSFFRMYPILPYSGFYCGGPACRIVKNRSRQSLFMLVNIGAVVTNICGFAIFGFDSNNADTIRSVYFAILEKKIYLYQDPELGWLADRGGSLLIFGDFGNAQYFKFGMINCLN